MDFAKQDSRKIAEKGQKMRLVDPVSREPLGTTTKPATVIVRGSVSRTVQAHVREKQRAMKAAEAAGDSADLECMEDLHNRLIDAAIPFIIGFENVTYAGVDAKDVEALARAVLNTSFPTMKVKTDEDGEAVLGKDGEPKYEMANYPLASQITDFADDQANWRGNA